MTSHYKLLLFWAAAARRVTACRFIAYCGNRTIDARSLLLDGENNLLALATSRPLLPALSLSRHYDEAQVPLRNVEKNLDGYGVSWYEEGESFPRRVRSANPIIKDNVSDATFQNLLDGRAVPMLFRTGLDKCIEEPQPPSNEALESRAVFAHVRAASPNSTQKETNSHPFAFHTLTWLHNGHVWGFEKFREALIAKLPRKLLPLVAGDTDSELAGAVFASHLAGFPYRKTYDLVALRAAMLATVANLRERSLRVHETITECPADMPPSSLNFAVSDGRSLVVIRFRSSMSEDPPTLYYRQVEEGVIVASEPSSSDAETLKEWTLLGKNRMLSYSPSTGVHVECVCPHSCDADVSAAAHFSGRPRRDFLGGAPDFYMDLAILAAAAVLTFLVVYPQGRWSDYFLAATGFASWWAITKDDCAPVWLHWMKVPLTSREFMLTSLAGIILFILTLRMWRFPWIAETPSVGVCLFTLACLAACFILTTLTWEVIWAPKGKAD